MSRLDGGTAAHVETEMWRGWRRLLSPWLVRAVRRARRRSALLREIGSLETWERNALLRDLRLSEAELSGLSRGNLDRSDLLPRLMRTLSLGRLDAHVLRDLRRVCAQCQSAGRCAKEVDRGSAAVSFSEFCPNAHTLRALQAELPPENRGALEP
jgi:hypothetical protein